MPLCLVQWNYTDMEKTGLKPNLNHLTLFTSSGLQAALANAGMKVVFMQSNGKRIAEAHTASNGTAQGKGQRPMLKDLLRRICPDFVKKKLYRPRQILRNKRVLNTRFTTEQLFGRIDAYEFFQYGPGPFKLYRF